MKFRLGREISVRAKKPDYGHQTPITKPSNSEISVFQKYLQRTVNGNRNPKVLIIGCSPELRDLTAENKLRTTVVANDLEVIERTSKLMKRKNENEHWFEGDITKLPFKSKSFDVVFGDNVICNVSPFNKEIFYKRIGQILKRGGFAVLRSVVFGSTAGSFEKKLGRHLKIVEKEFGKQGIFAEHFPIYFMRPK